jgi:hypothetical protein
MSYTNGLDDPTAYFQTKTYSGNGVETAITNDGNSNLQPDLIWFKARSAAYYHGLFDVIRGTELRLSTNETDAESSKPSAFTSFDSNGFTVGADVSNTTNTSGQTFVAWQWKANGAGVSNTAGDIASTVSANTTSGFSIVSFDLTGQTGVKTVGHGLGTAPKVVITKRRSGGAGDWTSYFGAIGNSYLVLNKTNAGATSADFMNNTAPTSSVFTVGDPTWWAQSPFIAYCFAEVKGYSKFGSYTGNGSTDGTFVYTGFKPSFLIVKESSSAGNNWQIGDNKRNGYNVIAPRLEASTSDSEYTNLSWVDFVSNGFKIRSSDGAFNTSGNTYIYMAFAENPFVTSTSIPTTAR